MKRLFANARTQATALPDAKQTVIQAIKDDDLEIFSGCLMANDGLLHNPDEEVLFHLGKHGKSGILTFVLDTTDNTRVLSNLLSYAVLEKNFEGALILAQNDNVNPQKSGYLRCPLFERGKHVYASPMHWASAVKPAFDEMQSMEKLAATMYRNIGRRKMRQAQEWFAEADSLDPQPTAPQAQPSNVEIAKADI